MLSGFVFLWFVFECVSCSFSLVLIFCLFCPILLCLFQLPICLQWEREGKECGFDGSEVLSWEEQGEEQCDQNILCKESVSTKIKVIKHFELKRELSSYVQYNLREIPSVYIPCNSYSIKLME